MADSQPINSLKALAVEECDGKLKLTAVGAAKTPGWCHGELSLRAYIQPPADGIQDVDFMAVAPDDEANRIQVEMNVGATGELEGGSAAIGDWLKGFRIHTRSGAEEFSWSASNGLTIVPVE